jgi:hypothetical protein
MAPGIIRQAPEGDHRVDRAVADDRIKLLVPIRDGSGVMLVLVAALLAVDV